PSSVTVRYAPGTLISNPALSPNNNAAQDTAAHLMDAYWTIAPVGGSGYSYNVRMFYKPTTMGTVPYASDIKTANRQVNGQHEWWNTNSFTTVLDTVIGMFGLDYQTEGTSYTATTTISSPLPVKLTNFTARKNRLDAVLNWTTAQERNSSHFVVERSFNRVQFTAVGRVAAAGNTTARSNYNFTDEQVGGIAKNQTVYYRLKIVDLDGRVEYSPIASVRFEEATRTAVNVFPNPFQSDVMVQINALSNTNATISVFDIMGKKVAEFVESVVEGDNAIALSKLNSLTNGVYFVKVNMDGNEVVTKLIKQ
ncbi:MAG: T9SS type A sorting domain-containing protein, partial [Bacteroidia bacterium]|nr:T9SS type A sorting domain-containing protein [Bacteroidia bacterium]